MRCYIPELRDHPNPMSEVARMYHRHVCCHMVPPTSFVMSDDSLYAIHKQIAKEGVYRDNVETDGRRVRLNGIQVFVDRRNPATKIKEWLSAVDCHFRKRDYMAFPDSMEGELLRAAYDIIARPPAKSSVTAGRCGICGHYNCVASYFTDSEHPYRIGMEVVYEDALPDMSDAEYNEWFAKSAVVYGVRMGPKPTP